MGTGSFETQFKRVLAAGQKRDYKKAIILLEDMAARGLAEEHPEILLYLARSWHSESMYARAASCARSYLALRSEDGAGWFFLGRSLFSNGEFERSVHAFRKSLEYNASSIDARTFLGFALLKCRKPSLARAVFEEALASDPDNEKLNQGYRNALFVEAVRTYRRGDAETSRQMLTFLINNDIDGVVPRLYLGHALRDLGYTAEAIGQYEAAMLFAPDDAALAWYPVSALMQSGNMEGAVRMMQDRGLSTLAGDPSGPAVSLTIVKNHIDREEWSEAVEASRSFIRSHGDNAQVQSLMAEAFRNLGNAELALVHFRRALSLDRSNPSPHYGILMVHIGGHDWASLDAAVSDAAKAGCDPAALSLYRVIARAHLDAHPEEILSEIQHEIHVSGAVPELFLALARTYYRLGLADLASGWYRKVIESNPDDEESRIGHIACCETLLSESGVDGAESSSLAEELENAYAEYLERWGDNASIQRDYIRFLADRERWSDAADAAEQLLSGERSPQLERQLALFRRKAGQYRQAAVLYRDQLRADPENRNLLANLVYCLDRMGETSSALSLMQKANKVFKPDANALLIEGRLQERAGNHELALETFRKAVDLFPADVRCWEEIASVYEKKNIHEMAAMYRQKARDLTGKTSIR